MILIYFEFKCWFISTPFKNKKKRLLQKLLLLYKSIQIEGETWHSRTASCEKEFFKFYFKKIKIFWKFKNSLYYVKSIQLSFLATFWYAWHVLLAKRITMKTFQTRKVSNLWLVLEKGWNKSCDIGADHLLMISKNKIMHVKVFRSFHFKWYAWSQLYKILNLWHKFFLDYIVSDSSPYRMQIF